MAWIKACAAKDIKTGEAYKVETDPPVAVFNIDGTYYAVDDTCTHGQSSLSEGYVEDCEVECAWHFGKFDLRTGQAVCFPAVVALRTYKVRLDDGQVLVDVPEEIAGAASVERA